MVVHQVNVEPSYRVPKCCDERCGLALGRLLALWSMLEEVLGTNGAT